MPCNSSSGISEYYKRLEEDPTLKENDELKRMVMGLQSECDSVTRILCKILSFYSSDHIKEKFGQNVLDWWEAHKKWDEENKLYSRREFQDLFAEGLRTVFSADEKRE